MEKLASLTKRRGYVFQSSEIYGGTGRGPAIYYDDEDPFQGRSLNAFGGVTLQPNQHLRESLDVDTVRFDRRSTGERVYTVRIINDHPIAGIGFGEPQFVRAMQDYGFEQEFGVATLDAPHNSYLQAAVYAGIPTVLAFLIANGLLILKAIGAANRNLYQIIAWQAVLYAVAGYVLGIGASFFVADLSAAAGTRILITPFLVAGMFVLTVVMCITASFLSIIRVTNLEPAMVFK